jgi:2-dehydro-3-deoxygalactonokinase
VSGSRVIGDWGNTRLRLWRLENDVVVERREGPGIAQTGDLQGVLAAALGDWGAVRITLCGMAGARNGLREAPYLACPADVQGWASQKIALELGGRTIAITPGLASLNGRTDVMRGEETQIFGAMELDPSLESGTRWLVLPGTHSKWVCVVDGRIEAFRTFMTGELFEMLQRSSLFAAGGACAKGELNAGFRDGLDSVSERAALSSLLFEARSAQLVGGKSASWASEFVSGLLIGSEIAEMGAEGDLAVVAEPHLASRYDDALSHFGLECKVYDGEACTIAGLSLLDADD